MFRDPNGPIERYEWGSYQIKGRRYTGNIRVFGNISGDVQVQVWREFKELEREWHVLYPDMVIPVLKHEPEVIIIGNGAGGAVSVPDRVIDSLRKHVKDVLVLRTPEACRAFNESWREGWRVVALLHSTC